MSLNRMFSATGMLKHVLPMYQPIINVSERRVVGFEALARCVHPRWVGISPQVFVPVARRGGVLDDMTITLCEKVAQDLSSLDVIHVNVELNQLADPAMVERIVEAFAHYSKSLSGVVFEITEEGESDVDYVQALHGVSRLKSLGAELALDDFGNGHSNFERLYELPVDMLKIPRNLIHELATGHKSLACVRATLALADELGLKTIVEGVDNYFQIHALKQMGCINVQGFWFSRPLTFEDAKDFKQEHVHSR